MSYFRKTNSYKTTESEKVTKPEGTIEFDMKGTRRKRDNHLDQIMGELSIGKAITPYPCSIYHFPKQFLKLTSRPPLVAFCSPLS